MSPVRIVIALRKACALRVLGSVLLLIAAPLALPSSRHATPAAAPVQADLAAIGEAIYRFGVLPSGQPLKGERAGGVHVQGRDAACVNCHRRSGLGAAEGRGFIPPVTGQFLFHVNSASRQGHDLPFIEGARPNRQPYTTATLARAIRSGAGVDGKPLSVLMPRFSLDNASMAALIAYLKPLSSGPVPGVGDSVLQFATIVTPDADPVKRDAMLLVLNDYFAEKNANARFSSPKLYSYRKQMFMVTRHWQLHVWELKGPADTWVGQLQHYQAAEPVFAVISGIGGRNWAPVHHFCEQSGLPCLFPNVQLPFVAESDFHSLYFSKGVLLEAGLINYQLHESTTTAAVHRLVQVFRADDIGSAAAGALETSARKAGIEVVNRAISGDTGELAAVLNEVGPADGLVLWLRPGDLAALGDQLAKARLIWISGLMGGLENAPLPASWRGATRMTYPFDLPEKRVIRVDYPLGWFRIRKIPVTDLQVQADTFLACGLLSETMNHLADAFVRDYLIERIEGMLEHRVITGYYPRLALAPEQRFASKGGYVVRFAADTGTKLAAASEWIVP